MTNSGTTHLIRYLPNKKLFLCHGIFVWSFSYWSEISDRFLHSICVINHLYLQEYSVKKRSLIFLVLLFFYTVQICKTKHYSFAKQHQLAKSSSLNENKMADLPDHMTVPPTYFLHAQNTWTHVHTLLMQSFYLHLNKNIIINFYTISKSKCQTTIHHN